MPAETKPPGLPMRPVLLILAVWMAITLLSVRLLHRGDVALDEIVTTGIAWEIAAAAGFVVAACLYSRPRGLALGLPDLRVLPVFWLPILIWLCLPALAVASGLPPTPVMALLLVNTFLVGVSEEMMFRGLFYASLRRRLRIWPAILWSSVAFGGVHVLNGFVTGDFTMSVMQALAAAGSGLLLMAMRLRTGSLWSAIVYHALWDWILFVAVVGTKDLGSSTDVEVSGAALLLPVVMVMPNALYGLWLLRKVGAERPPGDVPMA